MKKELVKNWMSRELLTVTPQTKLPEAHRMMVNEEIRRLPVVSLTGKLLGIVTLGDMSRGAAFAGNQSQPLGNGLFACRFDNRRNHDTGTVYGG
jgi:CBS-domain-containing membrane protein